MKKTLILIIILSIFMIGCRDNQNLNIEDINHLRDESAGVKDYLWFNPPNLGFSNFNVNYDNQELIYSWTVSFHEKFYQKLLIDKPKYYYKLQFPKEVINILKIVETEFYQFHEFEQNGERKYTIEIKLDTKKEPTEKELELLRNNTSYNLQIFDENLNMVTTWEISKLSENMTNLFD